MEARLPWSDMNVDGKTVRGKTMGWNVLYTDKAGGTSTAFSWSPDVSGFANNHMANNWGEITFVEGYVSPVMVISIGRSGGNVEIVWPAGSKLESATAVQGPWRKAIRKTTVYPPHRAAAAPQRGIKWPRRRASRTSSSRLSEKVFPGRLRRALDRTLRREWPEFD